MPDIHVVLEAALGIVEFLGSTDEPLFEGIAEVRDESDRDGTRDLWVARRERTVDPETGERVPAVGVGFTVEDTEGKEHFFYITGGMLEVQPHAVMVLADTALRGDQLDEAAALAARDEAARALEGISAETDVAKAQAELAEAEARYRAAQKLKGKR